MQLELAAFCEFSKAGAYTDEIWTRNGYAQTHVRLRDIVDFVLVESEAIRLIMTVHEVNQVFSLARALV